MSKFMFRNIFLSATMAFTLLACSSPQSSEVNLYSARKEQLIKPMLDEFTRQTGIKVNLVTGKADALLQRLQSEGANSPADVLITTDAGRLHRAKQAGVLQAVSSAVLTKSIPASYRDPQGYWFGLSLRARPIIYAKDRVQAVALSSYEALADEQWHKRICIRSSSNIYNQSLVASMIAANGVQATETWANRFVKNFARPPKGGDRDQIKAVASGQCDIAIANTYYLGQMIHSDKAEQKSAAAKVAVFWPNTSDRGTHVNISGAAVTQSAKHKDAAIKLIEFLTSDVAQQWYADTNLEYPVSWGTFKADTINLSKLGELNAEAVKLMDRAGWQ